jgi:hypothetical protein
LSDIFHQLVAGIIIPSTTVKGYNWMRTNLPTGPGSRTCVGKKGSTSSCLTEVVKQKFVHRLGKSIGHGRYHKKSCSFSNLNSWTLKIMVRHVLMGKNTFGMVVGCPAYHNSRTACKK